MRRAHRAAHPAMWLLVGLSSLVVIVLGLALKPAEPVSQLPEAAIDALDGAAEAGEGGR